MHAQFLNGTVSFPVTGADPSLSASIEFIDETAGRLAARRIEITDPAIIAAVRAYVEEMLPTLAAQVGTTVTLPDGSHSTPTSPVV